MSVSRPFLYNGFTLVIFNWSGKFPVGSDKFSMCVRTVIILEWHFLIFNFNGRDVFYMVCAEMLWPGQVSSCML
jgi:hypothetical protein